MMKRSLIQLFCVLCLLVSQQAAFTHASWHAHEQSVRHRTGNDKPSAHGELCKLHGLFNQVVGAAPGTILHVALAETLDQRAGQLSPAMISVGALTARSRGPPTFPEA